MKASWGDRRRMIAGAALLGLALAGCSGDGGGGAAAAPSGTVLLEDSGMKLLALAEEPDAHMDALLQGNLAVDEGGCAVVAPRDGSGPVLVVFPHGTTLEAGVVQVPGKKQLGLGDLISLGGGIMPLDGERPRDCTGGDVFWGSQP
ncbi:hypothetical protein ACQ3I4_13255 [Zafaria sp. Z1313]|uniref:hypothetical protein n=1 Tax=unclassified Zafaria TaxID=2828765 RepID=UPI002E7970A4|nr:hypothetical protein [Zafaria sp. J156]MEE1621429.1 hypothetical protein [Zafaria sp. J156]